MMIHQSKGKIYLSHQRGLTLEGNDYQSYHTFNFGTYFHQHKEAIGNLLFLNDDTLNTCVGRKTLIKQGTSLLLLPIVGGFEYKGRTTGFAESGQICLINPNAATEVEITNPYMTEWVNFLQIGIKVELNQIHCRVGEFDLESYPNRLQALLFSETENPKYTLGSIGKFGGRESGSYSVRDPAAGVYVFIIDGVFEVQDRLLQSRDGLALWDENEIEFEALTHEAIILFLELTSKPSPL